MRRKIKITKKKKKKKKRSLLSRVYWIRVGFVLASVAAATLLFLYVEEREANAALQESAWASDERMLLTQNSAASAIRLVRERQEQLDTWEVDFADLQRLAGREAEICEREDVAQARELELDLWRLGLEAREAALAQESVKQTSYNPDREFRLGVEAHERGEFEAAERHFRRVLRTRPSHEQALRYRDEAGYHFWVNVLARGGALATVAKRILRKAAIRRGARVY